MELNIRLRFDADHDSNMKILNTVDVSRFKTVLEELGKNAKGLTKEGVCLASGFKSKGDFLTNAKTVTR